jgi:membrane dipeptidase
MLIVDAHLDLAYNALRFGRDLRQPVAALRAQEKKPPNGDTATVTIPTLLEGGIALVFGTLFVMPARSNVHMPDNQKMVYENAADAYAAAVAQLDYYHGLADEMEQVRLVGDAAELEEVVVSHQDGKAPLLGIVPLMEGADPVRAPQELEEWYERGVRIVGPAWDDTRYVDGAWREGRGFTTEGLALIEAMADLGFVLDVTHLSDRAVYEALERYEGPVIASHSNARALVPGARQLDDRQIRILAERDGVIGVVLFNRFLKAGYSRTDPKQSVTVADVIAHIDHICQLLGDAEHVGIGSDLDGGVGREDIPAEMDTVADLKVLAPALAERGYGEAEIANIMGGNWLRRLRSVFESAS